jgi:hypothetical protein
LVSLSTAEIGTNLIEITRQRQKPVCERLYFASDCINLGQNIRNDKAVVSGSASASASFSVSASGGASLCENRFSLATVEDENKRDRG